MRDRLELGPVPCEEECMCLGPNYDATVARAECARYRELLRACFPGLEEAGCRLVITSNAHDFGTYHEVAVAFDDRSEEQVDVAFWVEGNLPATWDDNRPRQRPLPQVATGWDEV